MTTNRHNSLNSTASNEAALRLSEATRAAILEAALDCIVTIDHEGRVVDWNPAAEHVFGYRRAEAVGREMAELIIPPELRPVHRAGLARAVTTGHDHMAGRRVEINAMRKNGEVFPVELAITRISAGATPMFTGHIRDISKRKEAEQALRDSQRLLASITGNLTEALFRRSPREGLLFVNDALVKMFGYASAEEVRLVPPEVLYVNPTRRTELVRLIEKVGRFQGEEVEYRRKDGSTFWGLTSATGIREEGSSKILYFDGAIHDITGRKQAALRQAAQYEVARALAESTTVHEAALRILEAVCECLCWDFGSLWTLNENRTALQCVEEWVRPGLKLKEFAAGTRAVTLKMGIGLPGRVWETGEATWIPDVLTESNFPRLASAAKCGLRAAFGFPVMLGNETLGVVEFFSRDIRKPDAELLEMFAALGSQIGQFVERKRAEEEIRALNKSLERRVAERTSELTASNAALQESESRLRTVREHTPAGIVVLDTETGRFIEANETATQLFGLTRKQLLKVGPAEVSPEFQPDGQPSAEAAREKIQRALDGDFPAFEWTHLHSSGTPISCELRVSRMPGAGRRLVIGAILDITMRKKAEAELVRALEQEKELNQLKTNFVSVVSHEFRTPLGVIVSAADILENYFDRLKPEQRGGHLQDIAHAANQMTKLMEEVLLLGRVEAGHMEFKPEPTDLAAFCRRLVDEQLSASNRKCPIHFELKTSDSLALCDEGLLRHIFTNLLGNAVKYSSAGTPVYFSLGQEKTDAVFCVRDAGIGIPEPDQKLLFGTFHRGQNVGEIPGTGLGLTIVKRCVDLHGGTIGVESKLGHGTTFQVRLKAFERSARPSAMKKATRRKR